MIRLLRVPMEKELRTINLGDDAERVAKSNLGMSDLSRVYIAKSEMYPDASGEVLDWKTSERQ